MFSVFGPTSRTCSKPFIYNYIYAHRTAQYRTASHRAASSQARVVIPRILALRQIHIAVKVAKHLKRELPSQESWLQDMLASLRKMLRSVSTNSHHNNPGSQADSHRCASRQES